MFVYRWFMAVKLIFAFSVFISYGIQFYVPAQILFPHIIKWCVADAWHGAADSCLRIVFVLISCEYLTPCLCGV